VEEGADHTDHVRAMPITFEMSGMVTDFPVIVDLANNTPPNTTGQDSGSRVQNAYAFIESARLAGELVSVFTRFRTYSDMIIKRTSVKRTAGTGRSAVINLTLRQISFGAIERTLAPKPRNPSRASKENKGTKPLTTPSAGAATAETNRSILKSIF
jgi:hypothetical protein